MPTAKEERTYSEPRKRQESSLKIRIIQIFYFYRGKIGSSGYSSLLSIIPFAFSIPPLLFNYYCLWKMFLVNNFPFIYL